MTRRPQTLDKVKARLRTWTQQDDSGCWIFTGVRNGQGYGRFSWDGRNWQAHRASYELFIGPIPDGMTIDHQCNVKICVNPAHLKPMTLADNIKKSRSAVTHCVRGHPLSGENLSMLYGKRHCRACRTIRSLESKQRKAIQLESIQ